MSRNLLKLSLGIALAICSPLRGDMIEGSSSADFIDVGLKLKLLPLVGGGITVDANIGDLAPASGTAPPAYDVTNSPVGGIDVQVGNVLGIVTVADVSAATVTSNASSTIDGLVGPRRTQAAHTIAGLDISIADLPLLKPDLISITAEALTVTSAITGDFGALVATGTMVVTNLQVFVNGKLKATLDGIIQPDFEIIGLGLTGTSLVLNEQDITGDGINFLGLTTNAISLQLANVNIPVVGGLNGSVIVGPTQASVTAAVPEPSSCLLLGMAGLGFAYNQRRRISARLTADVAC